MGKPDRMTDDDDLAYRRQVGERIRQIRRQKRLSLQDVEARSDAEFKASVLGAYERGERAISVPRLHRMARFYDVPVDQLLPVEDDDPGVSSDWSAVAQKVMGVVITSSPGPIPSAATDMCRAAVPLETATPYLAPA